MGNAMSEEKSGVIGTITEDGNPVIYAFDNQLPPKEITEQLGWLTVISWKYDASTNNGMPEHNVNERMIELEDALSEEFYQSSNSKWVYNRTGNGLKEFSYYIDQRDLFIEQLNFVLESHPAYPIEINFYEDPEWSDFKQLLADFSK